MGGVQVRVFCRACRHGASRRGRSGRAGVGPDTLINPERIHPGQPAGRCDPPGGLRLDGTPGGMPGNAELVGQGGDRGVENAAAHRSPTGGPGGEFCPLSGQRALLCERRSGAVRVRALPDTLGPQQPHETAETRDVMARRTCRRPWPAATTPHSGQPVAVSPVSTHKTRPAPTAVTELTWMPAIPSSASIRSHQRPPEHDRELFRSGSLLLWLLGSYQFKEALASFLRTTPQLHEATPLPPASGGPNPAHRRRPKAIGFPAGRCRRLRTPPAARAGARRCRAASAHRCQ